MTDATAIAAELKRLQDRAHAPYSKVHVAAAVETPGGVFWGVNVENAAYPQGNCAETSAIAAAVTAGQTRIDRVYVSSNLPGLIWPCGGCRQRIFELAADGCEVVSLGSDGAQESHTIETLLPLGFRLP